MAGIFLKLLLPGAVTALGGTILALSMTSAPIATDLQTRSAKSLATGELGWASVRIEGRDAIVSGTATTQEMIDDAMLRVAAVTGVRAVSSGVVLAEFVSPFPFAATREAGITTLSGGYPSDTVHAAILGEAGGVSDGTRLLSGAPDAETFEAAAKFGLGALKQFDQGRIELADLKLTISGRAKTIEAYGQLQRLAEVGASGRRVGGARNHAAPGVALRLDRELRRREPRALRERPRRAARSAAARAAPEQHRGLDQPYAGFG